MNYQNRRLRLIRGLVPAALAVASLTPVVVAQDAVQNKPVPVGAVPVGAYDVQAADVAAAPVVGMLSKEKIGGARQFQLLNLYAIEIARIDATVKLDDSQKSRLNAGIKDLAAAKAQEFARNTAAMMGGGVMPLDGVPALPPKPKADETPLKLEEVKSYADVDVNIRFLLEDMFFPQASHREDAEWKELVQSVLNKEQHARYEQGIAAQKQNKDKTMVAEGIAILSVDLVLSKDQEAKLTAIAMEQLAKPKPAPPGADAAIMGVVYGMGGQAFYAELAKVDPKKIQDVLDPQQFDLLDLKLENHRRFGAEMEMIPGVIITQ